MNPNSQSALFHESIYDALKEVVLASGGTKVVGTLLWPEKSADSAQKLLSDCLNENRAEKLDPEQVMFILRLGRKNGNHAAINFISRDAGYGDPQPIEPEDAKAALMREFIAAQKAMSAISAQLAGVGLKVGQ